MEPRAARLDAVDGAGPKQLDAANPASKSALTLQRLQQERNRHPARATGDGLVTLAPASHCRSKGSSGWAGWGLRSVAHADEEGGLALEPKRF